MRRKLSVGIAAGDGLVARFGEVVVYLAKETASTDRILGAVEAVAQERHAGAAIAQRLAAVVFGSGSEPPPFGVVAPTADGTLVLLRGPVSAVVEGAEGIRRLDGARAFTWVDEIVREPVRRITVGADSGAPVRAFPRTDLQAGVVPGSGFVLATVRRNGKYRPAETVAPELPTTAASGFAAAESTAGSGFEALPEPGQRISRTPSAPSGSGSGANDRSVSGVDRNPGGFGASRGPADTSRGVGRNAPRNPSGIEKPSTASQFNATSQPVANDRPGTGRFGAPLTPGNRPFGAETPGTAGRFGTTGQPTASDHSDADGGGSDASPEPGNAVPSFETPGAAGRFGTTGRSTTGNQSDSGTGDADAPREQAPTPQIPEAPSAATESGELGKSVAGERPDDGAIRGAAGFDTGAGVLGELHSGGRERAGASDVTVRSETVASPDVPGISVAGAPDRAAERMDTADQPATAPWDATADESDDSAHLQSLPWSRTPYGAGASNAPQQATDAKDTEPSRQTRGTAAGDAPGQTTTDAKVAKPAEQSRGAERIDTADQPATAPWDATADESDDNAQQESTGQALAWSETPYGAGTFNASSQAADAGTIEPGRQSRRPGVFDAPGRATTDAEAAESGGQSRGAERIDTADQPATAPWNAADESGTGEADSAAVTMKADLPSPAPNQPWAWSRRPGAANQFGPAGQWPDPAAAEPTMIARPRPVGPGRVLPPPNSPGAQSRPPTWPRPYPPPRTVAPAPLEPANLFPPDEGQTRIMRPAAGIGSPDTGPGALVMPDGAVYPLDRPYVIGRSPQSDDLVKKASASPIVLPRDRHVSRVHAYVSLDRGKVFVRDASTRSGTFVAAPGTDQWTRIGAEPVELPPGWRIKISSRVLTFRAAEPPRV